MIELTSTIMNIEAEALDQLPSDWSEQLNRGLNANYLVGYDSMLDEANVWFSSNRDNAVHIPLNSLVDIVIDDVFHLVIGFVVRKFAQILLALFPQSRKVMVHDLRTEELRLPDDIPMTPIQQLSAVVPSDTFRRALWQTMHSMAA